MPDIDLVNLLGVLAIAFVAPLALGFVPRLKVPAVVLEILLGVVLGPSVLGWLEPDLAVRTVALLGLAMLLFLAGSRGRHPNLRGGLLTVGRRRLRRLPVARRRTSASGSRRRDGWRTRSWWPSRSRRPRSGWSSPC